MHQWEWQQCVQQPGPINADWNTCSTDKDLPLYYVILLSCSFEMLTWIHIQLIKISGLSIHYVILLTFSFETLLQLNAYSKGFEPHTKSWSLISIISRYTFLSFDIDYYRKMLPCYLCVVIWHNRSCMCFLFYIRDTLQGIVLLWV